MHQYQTAAELAKEYEQMAIAATNDYCRSKRHNPIAELPALAKQIAFCTTMHMLWKSVARRLEIGPEIYPSDTDFRGTTTDNYFDEYGI